MLAQKKALILREVTEGTGARIRLDEDNSGLQSGLVLSFLDLKRSHSPAVALRPKALRGYVAELTFGNFASDTLKQMQSASSEELQLARALVASVASDEAVSVSISGDQDLGSWELTDGKFTITAEKRRLENRFDDDTVAATCRELVTPLLAAMAELYGYDPIEAPELPGEADAMEGAVSVRQVRRRERNPRNRLLCLRIHGERCGICSSEPRSIYGDSGSIIEVHHLQPLSDSDEPRAYDPARDLIPLCPNCHRAVHTRRPVPWSPGELRQKLARDA